MNRTHELHSLTGESDCPQKVWNPTEGKPKSGLWRTVVEGPREGANNDVKTGGYL